MTQALHTWIGELSAILLCKSSQARSGWMGTVSGQPFLGLSRDVRQGSSQGSGWGTKLFAVWNGTLQAINRAGFPQTAEWSWAKIIYIYIVWYEWWNLSSNEVNIECQKMSYLINANDYMQQNQHIISTNSIFTKNIKWLVKGLFAVKWLFDHTQKYYML